MSESQFSVQLLTTPEDSKERARIARQLARKLSTDPAKVIKVLSKAPRKLSKAMSEDKARKMLRLCESLGLEVKMVAAGPQAKRSTPARASRQSQTDGATPRMVGRASRTKTSPPPQPREPSPAAEPRSSRQKRVSTIKSTTSQLGPKQTIRNNGTPGSWADMLYHPRKTMHMLLDDRNGITFTVVLLVLSVILTMISLLYPSSNLMGLGLGGAVSMMFIIRILLLDTQKNNVVSYTLSCAFVLIAAFVFDVAFFMNAGLFMILFALLGAYLTVSHVSHHSTTSQLGGEKTAQNDDKQKNAMVLWALSVALMIIFAFVPLGALGNLASAIFAVLGIYLVDTVTTPQPGGEEVTRDDSAFSDRSTTSHSQPDGGETRRNDGAFISRFGPWVDMLYYPRRTTRILLDDQNATIFKAVLYVSFAASATSFISPPSFGFFRVTASTVFTTLLAPLAVYLISHFGHRLWRLAVTSLSRGVLESPNDLHDHRVVRALLDDSLIAVIKVASILLALTALGVARVSVRTLLTILGFFVLIYIIHIIWGFLHSRVARSIFGGQASPHEATIALAWSRAPIMWLFIMTLFLENVVSLILTWVGYDGFGGLEAQLRAFGVMGILLNLIMGWWSFIVQTWAVAEAHQISPFKAFVMMLLVDVVVVGVIWFAVATAM